ncbi:MAG: hypothetical protein R3B48_13385 [Kofleriaceae bacterium]
MASLVSLGLVTACGQVPGGTPDAGTEVDAPPPPLAECKAQRAVYLIGGIGGLAWFTLTWPAPAVITGFQTGYSFDDVANAKIVATEAAHPLYVRRIGNRGLWEGLGKDPHPSVFVAGTNETHTRLPESILLSTAEGLAASGAVLQSDLAPKIAVLSFSPGGPYGSRMGAPTPVDVTTIDSAVAAFRGLVSAEVEQQLTPSAAQLARYVPPGATNQERLLGSQLAFTVNAMRLGLVSSVMMQAVADDPHAAFESGAAGRRADSLAAMLDEFYRELSMSSEPTCGSGGAALSLADNVVTVVVGDTPKNPFSSAGWSDATPNFANWMYVRSNGFTKPGWFGAVQPGTRINFNPITGAADPDATLADSTAAAFAGALYAIARGDKAKVRLVTEAPFDGVILR